MLLRCSHGISWDKGCSKCDVEESVWDILSIDGFIRIHKQLRNPDPETIAIQSWEYQRKRWYEYHDGSHELGGEA